MTCIILNQIIIIFNYSKNMFPFQKLGYYTCNELKEESELNNKNKNKNKY